MELIIYQSQCGNAARMQYTGMDGLIHNIFVDAGFERTFREILLQEIIEINRIQQTIDVWIVSHIHDDHIGGILGYIKAVESGQIKDIVQDWYYNPPRGISPILQNSNASKISEAKSIVQGDKLAAFLSSAKKIPCKDITVEYPVININGLFLTFLSPNISTLSNLRKKYPAGKHNRFERTETDSISDASAASNSDYDISLENFKSVIRKSDASVENGSCISLLADLNGKRILWLADAFPEVIIHSLNKLGYTADSPLKCDWVCVAHHGSSNNNIPELYQLIDCDNYLISADGINKAKLPTKASLFSILASPRRLRRKHLYFTYDNFALRSIFAIDDRDVYDRYNFEVHYNIHPVMKFQL